MHIILIGFMGTGKTTIGKELAQRIALDFIDIDTEIEQLTKMKIKSIFKEKGEESFRDAEEQALQQAINNQAPAVISTGGGIILRETNRKLMNDHKIILLEASVDEIYRRIKDDEQRPLLKINNVVEEIKRIYSQREKAYKDMANITIYTNNKSVNQIVDEIINFIL